MKKGKKSNHFIHKAKRFYLCTDCNKVFKEKEQYTLHKFQCANKKISINYYECPKCKTVMPKEEEKDHILAHKLDEKIQTNIKNGFESDASKVSQLTNQLKEEYCYSLESIIESENQITNENKNCIICLIDLKVGDRVLTLPCFHMFHKECIDDWFKKDKTCPLCKLEIKLDDSDEIKKDIENIKDEHNDIEREYNNTIPQIIRNNNKKNKNIFIVNNEKNNQKNNNKQNNKKKNNNNIQSNKKKRLKKGFLKQKHNRFNEEITDEEDFLEDLDDEDDSYNHYNKYITRNSNINCSHNHNHKIFDSDSNDTYSIHSNY